MTARNEFAQALVAELKRRGIGDYRIDNKRWHFRLTFTFEGRERSVIFSRTPSDWRGNKNNLAELRRILAPAKPVKASRPRRRRRNRAPTPEPQCPKLTVRPDPWAPLAELCEKFAAEAPS